MSWTPLKSNDDYNFHPSEASLALGTMLEIQSNYASQIKTLLKQRMTACVNKVKASSVSVCCLVMQKLFSWFLRDVPDVVHRGKRHLDFYANPDFIWFHYTHSCSFHLVPHSTVICTHWSDISISMSFYSFSFSQTLPASSCTSSLFVCCCKATQCHVKFLVCVTALSNKTRFWFW